MKALVIGSGAREHALVRSLMSDPEVDAVIAAPGNPGIDLDALCVPVDATDPAAVVALAREHTVELVVVGPEAPLVAGVADAVPAAGATRGPPVALPAVGTSTLTPTVATTAATRPRRALPLGISPSRR